MLQVRLWLNNGCGFLHFDLRSCPTARWIKPKEVQEAVWIWSWSSSALSAGGAAWPTSRTKRCSTAVQRPDTREWLTPWEAALCPHDSAANHWGPAGSEICTVAFDLLPSVTLVFSLRPSDGLETDGYCWSDHPRRVDGFRSDLYHIPRTSLCTTM